MRNCLSTRFRPIRALPWGVLFGCALLSAAGGGALLTGCAAVKRPIRKATHMTGQISIYATISPDANGNTPIAVDVVAVDEPKLLAEVAKLTATTWFEKRADIDKLHPGQLHVSSREWVPGEATPPWVIPSTAIAAGVLLFARYSSPGSHAAVLPQSGDVRVTFGANDLELISPAK